MVLQAYEKRGGSKDPLDASQCTAGPRGVGGWLLLFCVLVTIIGPALSVFFLSADLARILANWDGFELVPTFRLVKDVGGFGLTAFSLYVGITLWSAKPNAVRTAKALLIAALAYNVVTDFACLSLGTSVLFWTPTPTVGTTVEDLAANAISFAIWFTYLRESKRVKATYGSLDTKEASM
jgi:hypothetical protein